VTETGSVHHRGVFGVLRRGAASTAGNSDVLTVGGHREGVGGRPALQEG